MILSHKKRFIFFHTPKVAGSSISASLRPYSHLNLRIRNYLLDYLGQIPKLYVFNQHIRPKEMQAAIPGRVFNAYYKFAFVRNPFDWHVSEFHYHKQHETGFFHETFRDFTFLDYLQWVVIPENKYLARASQYDFLSGDNGQLLVDRIGKFENLQPEFGAICDDLNIECRLQHKNPSVRPKTYREFYSERERQIIEQHFERDLEGFDYDF